MTVTDFPIRVPSNDQMYSLVSDLTALANDVAAHLDTLDTAIQSKVTTGNPTSLNSITCTGTGTFRQVVITPASGTWTGQLSLDSINGLRLSYNIAHFYSSPEGRSWTSSVPIYIPRSGVEGNTAINWNYLFDPSTTTPGRLVGLEKTVTAIPTTYVTKATYNAAINNLNAEIANLKVEMAKRAHHVAGDVFKVAKAIDADTAKNAGKWNNRYLQGGYTSNLTVQPGQSRYFTASFYDVGYIPFVIAQAYNDDGATSVVCSIGVLSRTAARINYKNIGANAETVNIEWVAI